MCNTKKEGDDICKEFQNCKKSIARLGKGSKKKKKK